MKAAGFSVIELLLGIFFLTLFLSGTVYLLAENVTAVVANSDRFIAANLAQEGIEAAYSIRNFDWCSVRIGTHGLTTSTGRWALSGPSDTQGRFTRTLTIEPVYRNNHVMVPAGSGVLDDYTKKVTATVSWTDTTGSQQSVQLLAYITYWRKARDGMLVYGDGRTTADTIKYRILNNQIASWGINQNTADIDPATSGKALHAVQLYSSPTRDEKIMISKHAATGSTTHAIYAQVFTPCTGWTNVVELASYTATVSPTLQNFSGTYLANGDFMVVYSDTTTIPKFRIWDGTSWSAETAMADNALNTSGAPNFVVAKARPGTKEVMAAFLDNLNDINTQYFNGGTYETASWTLHAIHATTTPSNVKKMVDFDWSPGTPIKGALVFSKELDDKKMHIKIWTANGSGGGVWSATADSPIQPDIIGSVSVKGRPTSSEFTACHKDSANRPRIVCLRGTMNPAWFVPTNSLIANPTDDGPQVSFDVGYEDAEVSGRDAIIVYSDSSSAARLKKYNASSLQWDKTAITVGNVGSAVESTRVIPLSRTTDLMILLANTNQELYSIVWNGSVNALYTSPAAFKLFIHSLRGSSDEAFWYDFAWDQF